MTGHCRSTMARFIFFDPRATTFFVDWDSVANDTVDER